MKAPRQREAYAMNEGAKHLEVETMNEGAKRMEAYAMNKTDMHEWDAGNL